MLHGLLLEVNNCVRLVVIENLRKRHVERAVALYHKIDPSVESYKEINFVRVGIAQSIIYANGKHLLNCLWKLLKKQDGGIRSDFASSQRIIFSYSVRRVIKLVYP